MKRFVFLCIMLAPAFVHAQYIAIGANLLDTTTERYVQNSPTNLTGNRRAIEKIRDSAYWSIRTHRAFIRAVDSLHAAVNTPKSMLWVNGFGEVFRADLSAVMLDTTGTYASKTWVASRGYLTSFTQQNADWNAVSGVTQILNKPVIPTSTTTLTEGTNLYYTDTRARASNSAGTGIAYNSTTGVISNSAPDQTVSLTAGSGISVSGTYPSFTVTNTQTPGSGTVTSVGLTSSDFAVSGSPVTTTGSITANLNTSGVTAGMYEKVTVNNKGIATVGYNPTINNNVTRPINGTTFTISATQPASVAYYIKITCTASIGSAASGTVNLQYSTNGGSTWIDVGEVQNSNTVTLAIALNSVTIQSACLVGDIPANALVRMNTTSAGTTSVAWIRGNEKY